MNSVMAAPKISAIDTLHRPWQLKQSEFLKKYGTDYTTGRLIRYWFNKRQTLKTETIGSGAVAAVVVIPLMKAVNSGSGWAFGLILLLGGTITAASVIFLVSFPRFISFSRKKLFVLLDGLTNGKPLPRKYQKRLHLSSN